MAGLAQHSLLALLPPLAFSPDRQILLMKTQGSSPGFKSTGKNGFYHSQPSGATCLEENQHQRAGRGSALNKAPRTPWEAGGGGWSAAWSAEDLSHHLKRGFPLWPRSRDSSQSGALGYESEAMGVQVQGRDRLGSG